MTDVTITLPYGHDELNLRVPAEQLAWTLEPGDEPALLDIPGEISQALASPIGCPPLAEMLRGRDEDIVVLVDDATRPTPQHELLPPVLQALNEAGVPDEHITLLVALGTHRPHTEAENRERYGEAVCARVRVENLDQREEAFVDLGTTASGIPIHVSRRYRQASFRLAVGNIVPHMYCGWSGGSKIVQPGMCSHVTTAETHLLAAPMVRENLGVLDNPVRREMDEIGQSSGLDFIVNTVLNREEKVAHIVAGHVIEAHRRGVELAHKVYGVPVPEPVDLIIASSHPADRDFWQACKALNAAGMTVKPDGVILLLNPAYEDVAPDHPYMVELGTTPMDVVNEQLDRDEIADRVACSTYLAMAATRKHARIIIVSEPIAREGLERMGLGWEGDAERALAKVLEWVGPNARIGVMPQAADMLPLM